jgi:phosphoribosylglycinamide formyltransferase-1
VILQRAFEVPAAREPDDVLPRIHELEHVLLPEAVRLIARGEVRIDHGDPRRVHIGALTGARDV